MAEDGDDEVGGDGVGGDEVGVGAMVGVEQIGGCLPVCRPVVKAARAGAS